MKYIVEQFRVPLEAVSTSLAFFQDELEKIVEHSDSVLSICMYKFYNAPDAGKWPNVLVLTELLVSLPFSNGKVERIFKVKIIRTEHCTYLNDETLINILNGRTSPERFPSRHSNSGVVG